MDRVAQAGPSARGLLAESGPLLDVSPSRAAMPCSLSSHALKLCSGHVPRKAAQHRHSPTRLHGDGGVNSEFMATSVMPGGGVNSEFMVVLR